MKLWLRVLPRLRSLPALRSLPVQQGLLSGAWVTLGLIIVWLWVAGLVTQAAEAAFDARLVSLLDALVVATGLDNGRPFLIRPVSEPRFDRPLSGVYFQIEGPGGAILASRSLWDERLRPGRLGHPGVLMEDVPGPRGQHLRLVERDVVPPGAGGTLHILVAAALDDTIAEEQRTSRRLGFGFLTLGAGLVAAVVLQAVVGLRGLRRLRGVIAGLRRGDDLGPEPNLPVEVQPLLREIEALVQQNRATVERVRNHVGNLAHALRTRLSIVRNALGSGDLALVGTELGEAERLIQHHLVRARASALSGTAARDIAVTEVADEVGHALGILFAERGLAIAVVGSSDLRVRCDREDLAEMLGNLMENGCKWAATRLTVTVRPHGAEVIVRVSDDGPGLPADKLHEVQARGVRLDETMPGSGLGLTITTELAALYGGKLVLASPGPDGGLAADLHLPASPGAS